MYSYYDLIAVCERIETLLGTVVNLLQSYLPPIVYLIFFFVLLKIGFTCLRGYKV